jgi:hypothetical protein
MNWDYHEWWIGKDLKGGGRGAFEDTMRVFNWRDWGEVRKPLFRTTGNLAEVFAENLPNTNQKPNRHTSLLCLTTLYQTVGKLYVSIVLWSRLLNSFIVLSITELKICASRFTVQSYGNRVTTYGNY